MKKSFGNIVLNKTKRERMETKPIRHNHYSNFKETTDHLGNKVNYLNSYSLPIYHEKPGRPKLTNEIKEKYIDHYKHCEQSEAWSLAFELEEIDIKGITRVQKIRELIAKWIRNASDDVLKTLPWQPE